MLCQKKFLEIAGFSVTENEFPLLVFFWLNCRIGIGIEVGIEVVYRKLLRFRCNLQFVLLNIPS